MRPSGARTDSGGRHPRSPRTVTSRHVLVVDDNPANLKLLRLVLNRAGFVAHAVSSAEAALPLLGEVPFAAALLDVSLPGEDGLWLARRIRERPETRDLVIVVVTAGVTSADEERARSAGCDGFVHKPVDTRALPRLLAELVAKRGA